MPPAYHVTAIWDPEARVWTSRSDIPGLVIETETLAEFEALMAEFAPQMLAENAGVHDSRVTIEFTASSTRELMVA